MIPHNQLVQQLLDLGVKPGGILLVHCSFSRLRPVENGPLGLIKALQEAVGPPGTLVMPSMTDDDEHPFDPKTTPCFGMGIVADTFWRLPGVLRSDSPHAFAAFGPQAGYITMPHSVDIPHGPDSPVGRVLDLDGQVLLLGIDHTANTTIHLSEYVSGVRYRRKKHIYVMKDGQPVRFDYAEIDHCCQNFCMVDEWLDEKSLQRKGIVGHAEARLVRSRDILEVVKEHLIKNETAFLHPYGIDEQCDEARASIP